jgi:hypothetical protein
MSSGEWPASPWRPDEDEVEETTAIDLDLTDVADLEAADTIAGAVPVEEVVGDITVECVSLRDVLLRAKDLRHENDLVDYLVLSRF